MDEKIDALDRISDLPEFIMHHILSFLPRKEAGKTSLLSKKWNCVWSSFPILDFDQCHYVKNNGSLYQGTRNKKRVKRFMNIVDKSFGRFHEHKFRLQKFKLHMTLVDFKLASLVDKWIEWAFAHDAKEIDLVVMTREKTYALTRATFVEQSTNGCKLERAFSRSAVKFYSLQKLSLRDICVNEETIQDIIHTCPFITDVDIIVCKGLKTVEISKLPKLRYFNLVSHKRDVECVKIEAPNLQYFRFSGSEQCLLDITACKDLKELCLDELNITDQLFHLNVSRFPLLESLVVSDCDMLGRIKISAQRLRDLRISGCQKLLDVEIDAPSLSFFRYFNNGDKMAKIFSKNAPCPLEFNLILDTHHVDTQWLLKLRELLLISNQRKTLRIVVFCREVCSLMQVY